MPDISPELLPNQVPALGSPITMANIAQTFPITNNITAATPWSLGDYYARHLVADANTRTLNYGYGIQSLSGSTYTQRVTTTSGARISFADFAGTYQNLTMRLPVAINAPSAPPNNLYAQYDTISFLYTGAPQTFSFLNARIINIECWGAGAWIENNTYPTTRTYGGYTYGIYVAPSGGNLYVYVGGTGTAVNSTPNTLTAIAGGWNGGGSSQETLNQSRGGYRISGGGGTDVRTTFNLDWRLNLNNRIIVAGGAGGGATNALPNPTQLFEGGAGGGLQGLVSPDAGSVTGEGLGGTQTAGGGITASADLANPGTFGIGGSYVLGSGAWICGGGGGWYGGGAGLLGGGGSGYISPSILAGAQFGTTATTTANIVPPVASTTYNHGYCRITIIG